MITKKTIISIGTDRNLFSPDSTVVKRQLDYASALNKEVKIIVFSLKKHNFQPKNIADNLTIYPTNSFGRLFYIWDAIIIAKSIAKDRKIVLVSAQDPFEAGLSALFVSKILKCPLHIQIHTDLHSLYFRINFLNRLRLFLSKLVISRAQHIRVVSNRIKENLQTNFRSLPTVSVLPIYVNLRQLKNQKPNNYFRKKYQQFDFVILWAGRLEQEKNPLLAIRAMSLIASAQLKVCLVMVGQGRLAKKISQKIKLMDNVFLEPWQDNLPSCLKAVDAYLSTSWYEGYGLTIAEAAAVGCPIISTDAGLAGSILIDGQEALICQPGDATCLAAKICSLVKNQKLRQRLTTEARDKILCFSQTKEEFIKEYAKDINQASVR